MHAYKVLRAVRSEFTGWQWSLPDGDQPGAWVHAEGSIAVCVNGIHASTPEQLPHWLGAELWEIELGGDILEHEAALVASQARLLRRVDRWDEPMRRRFAEMCLERAGALADGYPAGDGLVDQGRAHAELGRRGSRRLLHRDARRRARQRRSAPAVTMTPRFLRERSRQARWLRDQLQLIG